MYFDPAPRRAAWLAHRGGPRRLVGLRSRRWPRGQGRRGRAALGARLNDVAIVLLLARRADIVERWNTRRHRRALAGIILPY